MLSSKSMQNPTIPGRFTATSMVQTTSHVLLELLQWPASWAHCSALAPTVDSPYSSQKDPVKYQLNQGIPLLKTLQGPLISPKRRVRISQRPHHTWHGHTTLSIYHVVSHMSPPQSAAPAVLVSSPISEHPRHSLPWHLSQHLLFPLPPPAPYL